MPEINKEDFFAHLDKLTVLELVDYIKEFETRYGIQAAAAMPMGMMPMAAAGAAPAEEAEEKTEFDVILKGVGAEKIKVIKVVREVTNLGLKEAKDVVDGAPSKIAEGIAKEEAEKIKAKFVEVGAEIEIK
ncbi:MAG: 50S ribosomal protein L7 [Candidatus Aminicenantes bacterium ADurb.Bin508]|nr:MAG: 50S ribosomal protein L7 [Candidatus Aminicenantes bacterium ADurb.Bin508]HNX42567.1 50S ribosomal protein L7/L12 [Candidatus Aminicenantes bacterium]HPB54755.1 50S ribosomal protein L7/L12 [Candidatus Aminicenantes bacterium]HPT00740.1 50S ribosomal protein L7/L12 [Candidatus Aminicenantes bacterium]